MAFIPDSGSVAAWLQSNIASVITTQKAGSVMAVSGSFSPAANQSVSGTIQADIRGSVATVIIGGSIAASFTPPANQSVSGTVGASIIGLTPVTITSGNSSVTGTMSVLGTVPVTQATASNPWIVTGSVQGSFSPSGNQSVSGTVQTDVRGSIAAVIIGGSIATATTNSSVMLLGGTNVIGSVGALQGTNPWITANTQTGTVITSLVSTVPSSVIVGASIFGQLPGGTAMLGSVAALQAGTVPWLETFSNSSILAVPVGSTVSYIQNSVATVIIGGSIAASFTPPANQSVSGTVQTDVRSSVAVVIIGGSVATATTNSSVMLLGSTAVIGSVMALQGTNPWTVAAPAGSVMMMAQLAGSILATSATVLPGSVSGAITAPPGSVMAVRTDSASVITTQIAGSVMAVSATQGTTPWLIGSVYGNISGSVLAVPTGNQSVSGTVTTAAGADVSSPTASILVGVTANTNGSTFTVTGYQQTLMQITSGPGASITAALNFEGTLDGTQFVPIQGYNLSTNAISSMATAEGNWAFNTTGLQGMRARVSNWSIGSITARVVANPEDARPFAIAQHAVNFPAGSVATVANLAGSIAAVSATAPAGSIMATNQVAGSIMATSGIQFAGSVMAVRMDNVSVLTLQPSGSIMAVGQRGTWQVSVAGGYASGAASVISALGILHLGVRNDTMQSTLAVDAQYQPLAVGPIGELIVAPAPINKWINVQSSVMYGTSVQVASAAGTGVSTYITAMQIANDSGTFSRVKITTGLGSVVAWTVAPANGGSNIIYNPPIKAIANTGVSVSISGVSSVYISMQGFVSTT